MDDELVQAGSVLTQSYLENLLFQSVLYKDVVQFWEAILVPSGVNPKRENVDIDMAPNFDNKALSPHTHVSSDSLASDYAAAVDLGVCMRSIHTPTKRRRQAI